ncbi:hypothetical protein K439DRAFT_925169 [Ramaria rubella]|nr:hypothetical protein K439DRAFT_925169 [Ramaria rubella]
MEPPTHTSSAVYSRNPPVTLPPLVHPDSQRPRSSMGHSSHTYTSLLPIGPASRHTSHAPQSNALPPISSSFRPSSHRRTSSLSVNTADYEPSSSHSYPSHTPQSSHHQGSYHNPHESTSPTSSRAYACDICGANFSRAYDCKRHRDIHTRQGGHECPYCHKGLSRADALKRHMERGCSGMDEEDVDEIERERERERKDRRDKRHSTSGDAAGSSKYYYSSVNSRLR